MNDIKIKFEIIQRDETFTYFDYVEIILKDNKYGEVYKGYISRKSDYIHLVIENEEDFYIFKYPEVAEIKSII